MRSVYIPDVRSLQTLLEVVIFVDIIIIDVVVVVIMVAIIMFVPAIS